MLSGKRILITGANGGIGFAISELFLQNNANLVLFYHKNKEELEKLKKNRSYQLEIHQVDLMDELSVEKETSSILKNGPIDAFVHSVSHPLSMKGIIDLNWNSFQSNVDLQAKSFFQIIKLLMPSMKAQKSGKIVSILTEGVVGKPTGNMADYIVGKYCLLGLSKTLAVELERFNITVNCISPSMVDTKLISNLPAKFKEIAVSQTPLGRLTKPSEVASVVLFLCSDHSNYISDENIIVSAGKSIDDTTYVEPGTTGPT